MSLYGGYCRWSQIFIRFALSRTVSEINSLGRCKKNAKNIFWCLWPLERSKGQVTLTLHTFMLWGHMYTKFECCNFNIHWDLLRTKLKNIFRFLQFVTLKKVKRSCDLDLAQLWVMGHKYTKFETCNFNIHWDMVRTRFGPPARRPPPARPPQAITITTQSFDCGLTKWMWIFFEN